jgi:hypothetical protein
MYLALKLKICTLRKIKLNYLASMDIMKKCSPVSVFILRHYFLDHYMVNMSNTELKSNPQQSWEKH